MYSENGEYTVEVCFSPLSWPLFKKENTVVIVTDIFRATTAMCAAFANDIQAIIPVESIEESQRWKEQGVVCAGERDGIKLSCADFGNSPFNFMDPSLRGKTIAMNTTNGTRAIKMACDPSNTVLIGAFTNLTAVCNYAIRQQRNTIILCAGWKDRFSLEDALFAGAACKKIIERGNGRFHTMCDSAIASADLWKEAQNNLREYIEKAAHRHRLKRLGLDDILDYSLTVDTVKTVPIFSGDRITAANSL